MTRFRSATGTVFVVALALVPVPPAAAHGDIVSSDPEAGARVRRPPQRVRLVVAEPPARGSGVTVTDPCGERVSGRPRRDGDTISVPISAGSPGWWRVQLRSISAVDGHVVSGRFAFRVAGKRDCSADEDEVGPTGDAEDEVATSSRPPIENEDQGPGFPVIPFALGTIAVVGAALALRGKKS